MVGGLLAAAHDRRKMMDGRGATIVTANSAILALVLGLTVVVSGKDFRLASGFAATAMLLALLAFLVSAGVAIWVQSYGLSFNTVDPACLKDLVTSEKFWNDRVEVAVREDAFQQVETISTLVRANAVKSKWVTISLLAQFMAVGLLVVSICLEIATRMGIHL